MNERYFKWLYDLVSRPDRLDYDDLFRLLHRMEFIILPTVPQDRNRASDGSYLRYEYLYENPDDILNRERPCTVLEMMVALAKRLAVEYCGPNGEANEAVGRPGWFWYMIDNMGLGKMYGYNFDERRAVNIIETMLTRSYGPHGEGGLFTVNNPPEDLDYVEIWDQAMWRISETINFEYN